jgi:hypothetical protein
MFDTFNKEKNLELCGSSPSFFKQQDSKDGMKVNLAQVYEQLETRDLKKCVPAKERLQ